jgi:3'(2'), 5'-bisphosphate nucleotidase
MSNPPERFWLVDPLDGTKEFIEGYDEYTVNIALVDRGQPVLGVVDAPATGTTWYGGAGIGSMRRVGQSEALGISPSKRTSPCSAVISRSHLSDATRAFLEANNITETEPRGSSVKVCAIADGSADIYPRLGPTSIWDTAAGTAVARAAGCRVIDPAGRDLDYDPANGILREGFIVFPEGMRFVTD